MSDDPVAEACKILTTFKYCRAKASALRKCQRTGGRPSLFGGHQSACAREVARYQTCARERLEQVIGDIAQVAYTQCPDEARAFEACKQRTMSASACEAQDQRMMECASRMIIHSAHQKTS
jgi:hypothetical protein